MSKNSAEFSYSAVHEKANHKPKLNEPKVGPNSFIKKMVISYCKILVFKNKGNKMFNIADEQGCNHIDKCLPHDINRELDVYRGTCFIYLVRFYICFARQWQFPGPPSCLPQAWRCQAAWPWLSSSRPSPARPNNTADCAPEPAVGICPVVRPARCPFPATRQHAPQRCPNRFRSLSGRVLPFVSLAASGKGVNIRVVQELTGHADVKTSEIYNIIDGA